MKIVATYLGDKKEINWKGKLITAGIFKFPIEKPIFLDIENVKEDAICNRKHYGGINQAVYAYSAKHYNYFKPLYPNLDWQFGMFGENLTIDNLEETKIHQGDTFKVGDAILEVVVQRNPCIKLGIRFNDIKIVNQFWNTTMCGVYFKVLQTGFVKKGDVFKQLKSCPKNPTIADLYIEKRLKKEI